MQEGPSSKQPLDIFKFGRTPPRDEQDATFGSPSSSKAESYAVQQADPQDQSDPPQLQNNNPMPPVHEPIVWPTHFVSHYLVVSDRFKMNSQQ